MIQAVGTTPDAVVGGAGVMSTELRWSIGTDIGQKFELNFIGLPEGFPNKPAQG